MNRSSRKVYVDDGERAMQKKYTGFEEKRKCLTYMSRFWEADKYWLVPAYIFVALFEQNGLALTWLIYAVNSMSLSIYRTNSGWLSTVPGNERLTFSLPMSRKTIYDTRMYLTGILYILALGSSIVPSIEERRWFDYLMGASFLLFGHIVCGLCMRKPNLEFIAGMPGVIILFLCIMCAWVKGLEDILQYIETSGAALLFEVILCIVMLVLDIYVWARERKIFSNCSGSISH